MLVRREGKPRRLEMSMAHDESAQGALEPGVLEGGRAMEPSLRQALPYFMQLAIFPLVVNAAMHGGWWIAGPFVFFVLANAGDGTFGADERNMDPDKTLEGQLLWYKLAVWMWAALWPVMFVFTLWQILVVGHLSLWETALMAVVLAGVAPTVFIVGHELVHRRSVWERRVAEFLLASVSYPQYATEHVYIHHALVCTPEDPGSAPKGQSFWSYVPRDLAGSLIEAWRFERRRLARRHLPVWHYTNPFWRYVLETAAWYGLLYWLGGPWIVLIYAVLCAGVIFSQKLINYIQHYGLRRVRLAGGRFEPVQPRHSWSAASKFTNWMNYNMQRHPDHHASASRRYPLLQHHGQDECPQLPHSYTKLVGLALAPRRWFATMDPLVDRWRAHFYPQIDDWSAYDSPLSAARSDSFEAIAEILGTSPRLGRWISLTPELLDGLQEREFTDLELPEGFGPDSEYEALARSGLARLYWTLEFSVAEMKERISETPVQDVREAIETTLNWTNDKFFQVSMHMVRGSLTSVEVETALSNIAEASVSAVLSAVEEEFTDRRSPQGGGGFAAIALGDLASRNTGPEMMLDVMFVYEGRPPEYYEALCRRCADALRALSRGNLLFAPLRRSRARRRVRTIEEFAAYFETIGSAEELLELIRARPIHWSGAEGIEQRFEEARRKVLACGVARQDLLADLGAAADSAPEPGLLTINDMRGGLRDIEHIARVLQVRHGGTAPEILVPDVESVFRVASEHQLIAEAAADSLLDTVKMWRNLRGAVDLVADEEFTVEGASATARALITRSAGLDDFEILEDMISDRAIRTAAEIEVLDGGDPDR